MDAKLRASRERPHDSAGGEGIRRHRMRFSVTSRHPGSVEQPPARLRGTMGNGSTGQMRSSNPRQPAGHYGEWLSWANALEQPPARLRGGLREGPQISVWSLASRKGALCDTPLEVRSRRVRLSVRNGDTHSRHTRRLSTSQTHKAGHPSPHCHSTSSVPVALPLGLERSAAVRSTPSGSVRLTATRP